MLGLEPWEILGAFFEGSPLLWKSGWPSFQLAKTPPLTFLFFFDPTSSHFTSFSSLQLNKVLAQILITLSRKFSPFLFSTTCWGLSNVYTTQKGRNRWTLECINQLKPCTPVNTANGHPDTISLFPNKLGWN